MSLQAVKRVKTTTWPERHAETFSQLADRLRRLGVDRPVVLEVGPGAVSWFLHKRLAEGEGERLSPMANRYRAVLRNVDSLIRRIPGVSLYSYEPGELLRVLGEEVQLIVTDISERVIDAVGRQYPQLTARVFDFSAGPYDRPVDVVVCLCVLVRAADPRGMFANLYRSLRPGAVLVMDVRSVTQFRPDEMILENLGGQLWRKPA